MTSPEPPRIVRELTDVWIPWVDGHLLRIALVTLLVSVAYGFTRARHHRRHHGTAQPSQTSRRRRVRMSRMPAAQRNLQDKLRARVGHSDDEVDFIEWPSDVKATGAVLTIRYGKEWSGVGLQTKMIHELVEQMLKGKWTADHDHGHLKLRFIRQAPPFELPTKLTYAKMTRDSDSVTLGVCGDGTPCRWDLTFPQYAHALLAGMTGSGKSNALRLVIVELVQLGALIDILDAKGGEDFEDFEDHPGIRVWTEAVDQVRMLYEFKSDMEARQATRGAARAALPHRVLLIDESAELRPALRPFFHGEEYADVLLSIARLARSVHMHLVCATQKPTAKALTGNATSGGELRDMFGFRLGLGRLSRSASGMIFDEDSPTVASVTGRGVIQVNGEFTHVQTAKLDLADAVKVAARGTARFDSVTTVTDESLSRVRALARVDLPLQPVTEIIPVTAPADIPSVTLTCLKCGTSFETSEPGGKLVRCKNTACKHPRRVPVSARSS
jgi:DNA segregation ATPase FtsK/SpoIIIE-like protein